MLDAFFMSAIFYYFIAANVMVKNDSCVHQSLSAQIVNHAKV